MKILLPKMGYEPGQRAEVIRQAYLGLFHLVTPMLFDKYVDFIDVYAGILEEERESIFHEMIEQEDMAMLAQYIRDKGFQDGETKGETKGEIKGEIKGRRVTLERLLVRRFGPLPEWGSEQLTSATSEQLDRWIDRVLEADSIQAVLAE